MSLASQGARMAHLSKDVVYMEMERGSNLELREHQKRTLYPLHQPHLAGTLRRALFGREESGRQPSGIMGCPPLGLVAESGKRPCGIPWELMECGKRPCGIPWELMECGKRPRGILLVIS